MASATVTEDYLLWLEPQIRDVRTDTYRGLLTILFEKKFDAIVPMDDNRLVDGLDLRTEFAHENHIRPAAMDSLGPCSFLEVLIGLSRRMGFVAGGQPPGWAWLLLTNLELERMSDPLSARKRERINDILDTCIQRTYSPDGQGGFFPLTFPEDDMTQVELWYQMNAYVEELHPEH